MTPDPTTTCPADRGDVLVRRLTGWGAIVAPAVHTLTDVSEWVVGGYSATALWLNYMAFVPLPALLLGLYHLQRPRIHVLGLGGAVTYGFAFVYFAHTTLFALVVRAENYHQLWGQVGWLYPFHGGLMVAGGFAFGAATVRARVFPQWAAWVFLSGVGLNLFVALLSVPELFQTVGSGVRNLGLMGMGWTALRCGHESPMPRP